MQIRFGELRDRKPARPDFSICIFTQQPQKLSRLKIERVSARLQPLSYTVGKKNPKKEIGVFGEFSVSAKIGVLFWPKVN